MCEVKLDSSKVLMDMLMDCHADKSARNDKTTFFTKSTKSKNTYRILGFLMRNCGFQAIGKGVTLVVMTADNRAESTIYRKKTKSHKG